ncbi:MAG: hypothetical protein EBZ48_02365 [Proteobacteria bacterium]|nr:hypothetical protein [Pseudomonadota bacterium]
MTTKADSSRRAVAPPPGSVSDDSLARVLGDPDMIRAASDDPVLKLIVGSWRQVTVITLAVVAIFYAVSVFRETKERDLQSSGDAFYKVQREFDGYRSAVAQLAAFNSKKGAALTESEKSQIAELEKTRDASRKKLEDALTALSDMRPPFGRLAVLYRGLVNREGGDVNALGSAVQSAGWSQIQDKNSPERFFAELEALTYARALIDSNARSAEALAVLSDLATQGSFTHTAAALTMATLAASGEEQAKALALLNQVRSAHPEQAELLDDEIARLQ